MSNILKTLAAGSVSGDYEISRSLRFNSADTAYLSRTPASAGNRKTWTWSGWVKRSHVASGYNCLFSTGYSGTNYIVIWYRNDVGGQLQIQEYNGGVNFELHTTAVYRDVGAWAHVLFAFDSTQATSTDRMKLYINGELYTGATQALTYPSLNYNGLINSTYTHSIGRNQPYANGYHQGYMTEVHFVDGQALTPSSFGETNATTGVWSPIAYAGTYGTNGFYLNFSDNSNTTAATLGADSSGNGNNWTPNNFSVTAGVGNDSLVDVPTQYGVDTGAGGEVRGNYCTLNPLKNGGVTLTNGNLDAAKSTSGWVSTVGTVGVSSGKWYWEVTTVQVNPSGEVLHGIATAQASMANYVGADAYGWCYYSASGNKINNGSSVAYGATYTNGDVIGVALDLDAGELTFYKNGVSQGVAYSSLSGEFFPAISGHNGNSVACNFGQRPFAYTAPSGFKALCTTNLPDPTVLQGDDYFDTLLYTGNGTSQSPTGLDFQPDWVWIKERSSTSFNHLYDAVRGATKVLYSSETDAEVTDAQLLQSFNSGGFTVGNNGGVNENTQTYVAWNWKANGSGSSNTDGSITSTVSANPTAGISVVTYTGNSGNAAATIGHGLGVAPSMMILKFRNITSAWSVYHESLGNTKRLRLDTTDASTTDSTYWNNTSPTSTVFTVGSTFNQATAYNYVVYCFAEIPGFSAFGSYTANGSADGPFVYTGFRPAFVVFKESSTARNWKMVDSTRSAYNLTDDQLSPNLSNAESVDNGVDILSNGFKLRSTDVATNDSGQTFIYMAFAENPFKYALAR